MTDSLGIVCLRCHTRLTKADRGYRHAFIYFQITCGEVTATDTSDVHDWPLSERIEDETIPALVHPPDVRQGDTT